VFQGRHRGDSWHGVGRDINRVTFGRNSHGATYNDVDGGKNRPAFRSGLS